MAHVLGRTLFFPAVASYAVLAVLFDISACEPKPPQPVTPKPDARISSHLTELCLASETRRFPSSKEIRLEGSSARGLKDGQIVSYFVKNPIVSVPRSWKGPINVYACQEGRTTRMLTEESESRGRRVLSTQEGPWTNLDRLIVTGPAVSRVRTTESEHVHGVWLAQWRTRASSLPVIQKALALRKADQFEQALETLRTASVKEDRWTRYWAHWYEGWFFYRHDQGEKAAESWQNLADLPLGQAYLDKTAAGLRLAVRALTEVGQHHLSDDLLKRAGILALKVGDQVGYRNGVFSQAVIETELGMHGRADALLQKIIADADAAGTYAEEYRLVRARVLADSGQYSKALELLKRAQPPETAPVKVQFPYITVLARIQWEAMQEGVIKKNLSEIRRLHEKALSLAQERGAEDEIVGVQVYLAWLDMLEGHLAKAQKRLAPFRDHTREQLKYYYYEEQLVIVQLDLMQERHQEARSRLERIEGEITKETGGVPSQYLVMVRMLQARLAAVQKNPQAVLDAYRDAIAAVEELSRRRIMPETQAFYQHELRRLFQDFTSRLIAQEQLDEAFSVLNRSRALVLQRLEAFARGGQDSTAWREYQFARLEWEKKMRIGCDELVRQPSIQACNAEIDRRRQTMELKEKFLYQRQTSMPRNLETTSLAQTQAWLGPKAGLLLISGGAGDNSVQPGQSWASHRPQNQFMLVTGDRIETTAAKDPMQTWAESLKTMDHLYVMADSGSDSFDPFRAKRPDGTYWAETLRMSYIPHAGLLSLKRRKTPGGAVIIADPDGTLPKARREGRALREVLGSSVLLQGNEARRNAVLDALASSSLVHYAGHAESKYNSPWSVRLRLAKGAHLSLMDLIKRPPAADLIVLNGCNTGPALRVGGGGLPAALLQLGVRNVLVTTDKVKDGVNTRFIQAFYRHGGAQDPSQAFQRAVKQAEAEGDASWRTFRVWGLAN